MVRKYYIGCGSLLLYMKQNKTPTLLNWGDKVLIDRVNDDGYIEVTDDIDPELLMSLNSSKTIPNLFLITLENDICPCCNSKLTRNGTVDFNLNNSLVVKKQKYKCSNKKCNHCQRSLWKAYIEPGCNYTMKIKEFALELKSICNYLRILKSTNPEVFVFENVVGMVSANKGAAYQAIQEDFKNAGYDLVFNDIINMASLGVPQARKRLILIGVKHQINNNQINDIIDMYLKNIILEKYPLVSLEVFEGKVLTNLQDEYVKIMKQYSNSMNGIDNDYCEKWKDEYNNLTFDIKKDYLSCNNVVNHDEDEFKQAMLQHENILKVLGYFNRKVDKQSFLDDTNN